MPLAVNVTSPSTIVDAHANVYFDAITNTLEFGARIYNTPEAARERALSRSIRPNLRYLGPIPVNTAVSDSFISAGVTADEDRFNRVQEQERLAREERECDHDNTGAPEPTDGDSAIQPGVSGEANTDI